MASSLLRCEVTYVRNAVLSVTCCTFSGAARVEYSPATSRDVAELKDKNVYSISPLYVSLINNLCRIVTTSSDLRSN